MWAPNMSKAGRKSKHVFEQQELAFVPALLKVFDEILVNAVDAATRSNRWVGGGDGHTEPTLYSINGPLLLF